MINERVYNKSLQLQQPVNIFGHVLPLPLLTILLPVLLDPTTKNAGHPYQMLGITRSVRRSLTDLSNEGRANKSDQMCDE